ncbi:type I-E CRISPR-associated protein Cas5/CasD [Franconibacter daqui]|uniref:type I-E CRISPR-associated protein Cas5/CasD n=1 Tax=Franconibacter daqui TaxID=2047724 RepID=UPI0030D12249
MNRYLIFQLQGAMASWGEIAVGEVRHTRALPGRSALLGLLAAALGIRRDDDAALNMLNQHYQFIVCAGKSAVWARDYHTVQVPREARKVRYFTRKDELRDKLVLETTLSRRDYYTDGYWLVAVAATPGAPYTLEALQAALLAPVFPLCLGRKSHPLGLPLWPQLCEGEAASVLREALVRYGAALGELCPALKQLAQFHPQIWWEGDHDGLKADELQTWRDQPQSRRRWDFDTRTVKQGRLTQEAPCTSQK